MANLFRCKYNPLSARSMGERYGRRKRALLTCLSSILILTAFPAHGVDGMEPPGDGTARQEILILNSYHPGYAWSDHVQAGIIEQLQAKDKNLLPVIEYLDLKRLPEGKHLAGVKQIFRFKYQNRKFSTVIAMDNAALEFAIDNQAELFRNAPIVFCGINNYTPSLLKGHPDVTGIVEAIDIAGTIEVMLRLHPVTQEIFSPHDYTATGLAVRKELEALVPRFGAKVRFRFNDPLTMEELLTELQRLPGNSLVLAMAFVTDKSGRTFHISETTRLFSEHSPVPVYSTFEQRLGFGIVGGKLLSARTHGANAARIALRVLAGEKASAIPVVFESDSQFMFDYKVVKRFGIPLSALPEGSKVINKPVPFYAAHRVVILTASGIIVFMAAVISLLTINIIQRRRSAVALGASEAKYYDLYENAPDMYFTVDMKTATITECNNTFVETFGYSKEEILGLSIFEIDHPDGREEEKRVFQQFVATGEVRDAERMIRRKDGKIIHVSLNASAVRDEEGKITHSRSVWRDITGRKKAEIRLARLNDCFLQFGASPDDNINRLVAICGELMNATCALYNRLDNNLLCSVGKWQPPAGFKSEDKPIGHICYDVIQQGGEHPLLVRNLLESPYARTDPNVLTYGLQTYLGMVVKWKQVAVGSLCVVYQTDIIPSNDDLRFMTIIASAIAVEEDRRRVVEDLRRSEENFRRSLDNSPLGVRIVIEEGETVYANRALLDIYGYDSTEELNINPVKTRYTPESYAEFQIRREKRKRGDYGLPEYDVSIVRKDGGVRQLQVFRKEILWNGEEQFQVIYQDITEHRRVEYKLSESEKHYRMLFNAIDEGFCIIEVIFDENEGPIDYRFLEINPSFEKQTGLIGAQGKRMRELVPEHEEHWFEIYGKIAVTGQPVRFVNRAEQLHRWYDVYAFRIGQPENRQVAVLFNDITGRRRTEDALRKSEELYRSLFDNMMNGYAYCKMYFEQNRPHDFVYISVNRAFESLTGLKNVVGKKASEAVPGMRESDPELFEIYGRVALTGKPEQFEKYVIALQMWFSVSVYSPAKEHFISVFDIITERKQAEQELWASHEQLRALAGRLQAVREEERTQIAREIHDELGGALTGMRIDFSRLTRTALKIEDEAVKKSLLDEMDSLIKFIDATIHIVRRIAMELRPGVLDDLGLVAALEWQLKDFEKRTGIRCDFFPPGDDINLNADLSTALFRIFQEALTNVARHSGAREVCVHLSADADSSTLEVEDNGKGIEKEQTLSSKSLGILGMRERAQMFGGCVTVTGTPGRGTIVTVKIPSVDKRKMDRDQEGDAG